MSQEIAKKKTLASYAFELEQICSEIDDETGEITDAMVARFDDAKLALADKVDSWIGFLDALKFMTAEAKERKKRADKARKSFEGLNKRLREYLRFVMESNPNIRFKGAEGILRLQRNAEAVTLDFETADKKIYSTIDSSLLEQEPALNNYVRAITLYVIDNSKLKSDLKAGMILPWAKLTRGYQVRTK